MLDNNFSVHISFPLWAFLRQPLFTSAKIILNPYRFQHHYHVQLLERCWSYELTQPI